MQHIFESIKEIESKIGKLTDDSEIVLNHAIDQLTNNGDCPEWLRAIFEAPDFETCKKDWAQFAEKDVSKDDLLRVEFQLQAELSVLNSPCR